MKKKIIAFTLIELLVVVSIISIISITSISWLFNFLWDKEIKTKINEIQLYINELDKKIKNHDIYDYKIVIDSTINDSLLSYENIFDNDKIVELSYDNLNNSWTLDLNWLSWNVWFLSIYKDKKIIYSDYLLSETFTKNELEKNYNYKFISTLSWTTITKLNNIDLIKFDKDSELIKLWKITDTIWWSDLWKIEIINIWWIKRFYSSWISLNTNEIYLYFENAWRENYLKITK